MLAKMMKLMQRSRQSSPDSMHIHLFSAGSPFVSFNIQRVRWTTSWSDVDVFNCFVHFLYMTTTFCIEHQSRTSRGYF